MTVAAPPVLSGSADARLRQLYGYLFQLSEGLNIALTEVEEDRGLVRQAVDRLEQGDKAQSAQELRALIVNTAQIVRTELDRLETRLQSQLTAVSEQWGSFQETVDTTITATAKEVVQSYGYESKLTSLQEQAAGFSAYQLKTEGYIRQGFIDYDENGLPILGIAIGQNLKSVTVTVDGEEYEQFDGGQSCAFYTAEKVSFRIFGQEVAYVSNRKLYIGDVEITGNVALGGNWQISTARGFGVKWIGGA